MAFQVSPGVNVSEIDLTAVVPTVSTTAGAIAGLFRWGPIGQLVLVDSEDTLWKRFGKPTNYNAETFFTGANFLSYGNQLYVSRAANTTDTSANGTWSAIGDSSGQLAISVATGSYVGSAVATNFFVLNPDDYNAKYMAGDFATNTEYEYVARYPGALGNSIEVSYVDTANAFSSDITSVTSAQINVGSNTGTLYFGDSPSGISAASNSQQISSYAAWSALTVGDYIVVGNNSIGTQNLQVTSKGNAPLFAKFANVVFTANSTMVYGSAFSNTTLSNYIGTSVGSTLSGIASNTTIASVYVDTSNTANSSVTLSQVYSGTTGSGTLTAAQEYLNLSFATKYGLSTPFTQTTGNAIKRLWQYSQSVGSAPTVSEYQAQYGNSSIVDELHVVVADAKGMFTGVPGTILEVYKGLSRATDAQNSDGTTNYYVDVINQNSQYVWWTNHRTTTYSNTAVNLTAMNDSLPVTLDFAGGQDGFSESNVGTNIGTITSAYDLFKSTEAVSISLLMAGKADDTNTTLLPNYIIQNIAMTRLDTVAFVSPNRATVVGNSGYELSSVSNFGQSIVNSSYAVVDSGYKYQYDKYNDVYRYIPLNGDIAGLCVYTDTVKDPWWSPAGFNRGQIKNIVKLAWNPNKSDRDVLYPLAINPVVTFPGQGTVLFGDKTHLSKPSAFDRINVRRLFIVLEKAISAAAQYQLFEFNDAFTRAQFVSLVTPFLKDVQGRRGIYDYRVVCDGTNNTAQVIDSNQFVGDIYIKPAKSINFIQLNFVAVRTGVSFSEIVGKF